MNDQRIKFQATKNKIGPKMLLPPIAKEAPKSALILDEQ